MHLFSVSSVYENHPMIVWGHASHSRLHYEELPPILLLRDPGLRLSRSLLVQLRGSTRHLLKSFRCLNRGSYRNVLSLIFPPRLNLRLSSWLLFTK